MAFFLFLQNAQDLLHLRYQISTSLSGMNFNTSLFILKNYIKISKKKKKDTFIGIPYLMAACTTPFVGYGVDKIGKRGLIMIGSSSLVTLAHIILAVAP
jgi:hypothetical protein